MCRRPTNKKGDVDMATKSILKTIHIKDRRSIQALVRALEHAQGKSAQPVKFQRSVSEASREEIKKMFGAKDDGI